MNRRPDARGTTIVLVVAVMSLLSALAALLSAPTALEARRVDWHYQKLQADYLSLAGLERAKFWAGQRVLTNESYALPTGRVEFTMQRVGAHTCRVSSTGRVTGSKQGRPTEVRNTLTIQWP